ncbi:MAG TPA: RNA polymerase sigma factor [Candidatus Paceibacterota bacterium]
MTERERIQMNTTMTLAYRDHQSGLCKHSFFKVNNRQLSEDLVQDTFMKTWNYLIKGGKIDTMKAFLYHALNCLIIDEYRKRKTTSLDTLLDNGFSLGSDDSEHLVDVLDGKSAFLLIAHLPEKYQKVMRMRFTQNLSLSEMSLVTGETKNALAVQIHRGLEKLKLLYNFV